MLAYIVLAGIVVSGFFFAAWLVFFVLNRGINTELESAQEGRRTVAGQLGGGIVLLGIIVLLCVVFFQMDREPVFPTPAAGLPATPAAAETPLPPADTGHYASLLFVGIFVFGMAFILWACFFFLNRSINTSLVTGREDRRTATRQITFGAVLLAATIVLSVAFFQEDRTALVPDLSKPRPVRATAPTPEAPKAPEAPAAEPAAPEEERPAPDASGNKDAPASDTSQPVRTDGPIAV